MSIIWKDIYNTGIASIDEQHKTLVLLINELYAAQKKGEGQLIIAGILDKLVDNSISHFASEEELLEKVKFPGLEDHKKEHLYLTEKVMEFKNTYSSGKIILSINAIDFLKDWTINHILGTDKKYTPYINQR